MRCSKSGFYRSPCYCANSSAAPTILGAVAALITKRPPKAGRAGAAEFHASDIWLTQIN